MSAAAEYALMAAELGRIVRRYPKSERRRAAYLVARAALLAISAEEGRRAAAEVGYQLGDEFATAP